MKDRAKPLIFKQSLRNSFMKINHQLQKLSIISILKRNS